MSEDYMLSEEKELYRLIEDGFTFKQMGPAHFTETSYSMPVKLFTPDGQEVKVKPSANHFKLKGISDD